MALQNMGNAVQHYVQD